MPMGLNPNTITSANTVISMRCAGIYDDWITLEGAQTDAFLSFEDVTFAQTEVGVDGKLSMGFIPHKTNSTISLAANSKSVMVFENIYKNFVKMMDVLPIELRAYYPSVKRSQTIKGCFVGKAGGTGVGALLAGSTYRIEGISEGLIEVN
ncbi:virion structural protein [Acinetobacter phage XC1]|nr:virion structural protein [Acinetobacter phage XC1]